LLRQDGETRRRQRRAVLSSYTARGSVKEGRLAWRLHARASRELQSWRFVYSAERRRRRRRRHNERRDRCARVAGRIDRVIDGSGHQVDSTTRRARGAAAGSLQSVLGSLVRLRGRRGPDRAKPTR